MADAWYAAAVEEIVAGHSTYAAPKATLAIVDELRTLNLLLASQILNNGEAGDIAAQRLGLNRDSGEA
jgi:hypothetical protein